MFAVPNRFTRWAARHGLTAAEIAAMFNAKRKPTHHVSVACVEKWLTRETADFALEVYPRLKVPEPLIRAVRAATTP